MEGEFLQVKNRRARTGPINDQYLKTRMCIYFERNGRCRNGDNCPYAHSKDEIKLPECHYGSRCRIKERCKFSHPCKSPEAVKIVSREPPPAIFSTEDFPAVGTTNCAKSIKSENVLNFRDACAVDDEHKTFTVGGVGGISLASAVENIKNSIEKQPDTTFDLCFQ